MSRELKFKFIYGIKGQVETYFSNVFSFDEVEAGKSKNSIHPYDRAKGYVCLHRLQFTDLKDKNGIEIYEGDNLDNGCGDICIVKFGEHLVENGSPQGWYVEWPNGLQAYLNCSWTDCGEVVGNIHENFDLLLNKEAAGG